MFGFAGSGLEPANAPDAELWDDFPGSPSDTKKQPAVKGRITGKIVEWKGKFGWITPDDPINHPQARMKGGRIYLGQEDVAEVIKGVGAHVSFYVYADGTGLGAMLCCPADSDMASQPLVKKSSLKATPKPKAKSKAQPPGRKRVSEVPLTGKVTKWKATFGFITPDSPVEHPLYTGSLFLAKGDILNPDEVALNKSVSFFLYSDPQGLGADDVTIVDGSASPGAASPRADPTAIDVLGGSTLLRAKPKASPGSPPADGSTMVTFAKPTAKANAKGGMMKPSAKAGPGARPNDSELASKMAAHPELAKRLTAWMFDPGG